MTAVDSAIPNSPEALRLLFEGSEALARVEAAGIRIDVEYLDAEIERVGRRIKRGEEVLWDSELGRQWRREFGRSADLGKREQLATILFERRGHAVTKRTPKDKKPSTDEEHLRTTGEPFVERYLKVEKLKNLRGTFLRGVRREVVDGFIHPGFPLNFVSTYRGSSRDPNFTNIPIRDELMGPSIRRAFVPREGWKLLEVDYGSLEFRIAACFWQDSRMIRYVEDPTSDVHRDMAAACYRLTPGAVSKKARQAAKNQFVFPTLYGSYWKNTGRGVWRESEDIRLDCVACGGSGRSSQGGECVPCGGVGGRMLRDHLRAEGIGSEAAFVEHIRRVEDREFLGRFREFAAKRDPWWEDYQKRGWFQMPTGFVCRGIHSRNFVYNAPIQGSGFNCLLWSLTQIVRELERRRMRSLVVGQIYDSCLVDVAPGEFDDVVCLMQDIMTRRVRKAWSWIVVPLEIEAEATETNWHEKKEIPVE